MHQGDQDGLHLPQPDNQGWEELDPADDHHQVLAVPQMPSYTRNFITMLRHMTSHLCTKFE